MTDRDDPSYFITRTLNAIQSDLDQTNQTYGSKLRAAITKQHSETLYALAMGESVTDVGEVFFVAAFEYCALGQLLVTSGASPTERARGTYRKFLEVLARGVRDDALRYERSITPLARGMQHRRLEILLSSRQAAWMAHFEQELLTNTRETSERLVSGTTGKQRRFGPPADIDSALKTAGVVARFSSLNALDWSRLDEICEALDEHSVPPPRGARTWYETEGLNAKKAIQYRLKLAARSRLSGNS